MKQEVFTVAPMFSDHMVLQREKEIRVWGTGPEREQVRITVAGQTAATIIQENRWQVKLAPLPAGGPYDMEAVCGKETIRFQDVMLGEVWLAGGQSNMELELQNCDHAEEELKNADYDMLRFYNVVKAGVLTEQVLEQQMHSRWKVCTPQQAGDVSGVAYFCARRLYQELGVAIGVIGCYIGGTSATCWMDRETLMRTPETRGYVEDYDNKIGDKTDEQYAAEMEAYNRQWKLWDDRIQEERRKNPEVTWEYLNEAVGTCPWPQPAGRSSNFRPGNPYYAMLERVMPYTLRGFWYYQGEEDTYKAESYLCLMQQLIGLWRRKWQDEEAPFILHQLPMFTEKGMEDDKCWAILREQQMLAAQSIPNTYLNVLIDCGEYGNIHPTDKQTVGGRLALICMNHIYGIPCKSDAPMYQEVRREGAKVRITFHCESLVVKGSAITLFELAGDDGVFYPAHAEIVSQTELLISCASVLLPKAVRYAWTNFGIVTLYGESGLPVAPFRAKVS